MRALEAGLGIMGGTSPYALSNIGKGAEAAARGYGEDIKEQKKREAAYIQSAAEQARKQRLEKIEDITAGEKLFEKDLESQYRMAVLNKPTDLRDTTKIYFDAMVANGADPKDPRTMASAREKAYEDVGQAYRKIEHQAASLSSAESQLATKEVGDIIAKTSDPRSLKYRELMAKDEENAAKGNPTDLAGDYKRKLFTDALSDIRGRSTPAAPAAPKAGTPPDLSKVQGIPKGSTVGKLTAKGWEVLDSKGTLIGHIKE